MPDLSFITSMPEVKVFEVFGDNPVCIRGVAEPTKETCCPRCESKNYRIKSSKQRTLKHGLWGQRLVLLVLRIPKLFCKSCSKYFTLQVSGLLPYKRSSEQFRLDVFHRHHGGHTQTHIHATHSISPSTVERWYKNYVVYRVKELSGRSCPVVLGIDEHFFSRKLGYATTFVDLRNHKVFDVVLGKYESDLKGFLEALPGRDKVKVVVMDLCEHYRRLVQKYFPNAMIVSDRFHVIRWINHQFLNAWKSFDQEGRKNRGLLSLMRRHEWNLNDEQKQRLQSYFEQHPEMKAIYDFKQGLNELLLNKRQNKQQVKDLIPQFLWHLEQCLKSPIAAFKDLGKTLRRWQEPIVRMWRFTKSNGITEGLHNKMEMLSRRAFGFRNFENYRLRVIALCGWNGVFAVRS